MLLRLLLLSNGCALGVGKNISVVLSPSAHFVRVCEHGECNIHLTRCVPSKFRVLVFKILSFRNKYYAKPFLFDKSAAYVYVDREIRRNDILWSSDGLSSSGQISLCPSGRRILFDTKVYFTPSNVAEQNDLSSLLSCQHQFVFSRTRAPSDLIEFISMLRSSEKENCTVRTKSLVVECQGADCSSSALKFFDYIAPDLPMLCSDLTHYPTFHRVHSQNSNDYVSVYLNALDAAYVATNSSRSNSKDSSLFITHEVLSECSFQDTDVPVDKTVRKYLEEFSAYNYVDTVSESVLKSIEDVVVTVSEIKDIKASSGVMFDQVLTPDHVCVEGWLPSANEDYCVMSLEDGFVVLQACQNTDTVEYKWEISLITSLDVDVDSVFIPDTVLQLKWFQSSVSPTALLRQVVIRILSLRAHTFTQLLQAMFAARNKLNCAILATKVELDKFKDDCLNILKEELFICMSNMDLNAVMVESNNVCRCSSDWLTVEYARKLLRCPTLVEKDLKLVESWQFPPVDITESVDVATNFVTLVHKKENFVFHQIADGCVRGKFGDGFILILNSLLKLVNVILPNGEELELPLSDILSSIPADMTANDTTNLNCISTPKYFCFLNDKINTRDNSDRLRRNLYYCSPPHVNTVNSACHIASNANISEINCSLVRHCKKLLSFQGYVELSGDKRREYWIKAHFHSRLMIQHQAKSLRNANIEYIVRKTKLEREKRSETCVMEEYTPQIDSNVSMTSSGGFSSLNRLASQPIDSVHQGTPLLCVPNAYERRTAEALRMKNNIMYANLLAKQVRNDVESWLKANNTEHVTE